MIRAFGESFAIVGKAARQQTAAAKLKHRIAADEQVADEARRMHRNSRERVLKSVKMKRNVFVSAGNAVSREAEYLNRSPKKSNTFSGYFAASWQARIRRAFQFRAGRRGCEEQHPPAQRSGHAERTVPLTYQTRLIQRPSCFSAKYSMAGMKIVSTRPVRGLAIAPSRCRKDAHDGLSSPFLIPRGKIRCSKLGSNWARPARNVPFARDIFPAPAIPRFWQSISARRSLCARPLRMMPKKPVRRSPSRSTKPSIIFGFGLT